MEITISVDGKKLAIELNEKRSDFLILERGSKRSPSQEERKLVIAQLKNIVHLDEIAHAEELREDPIAFRSNKAE